MSDSKLFDDRLFLMGIHPASVEKDEDGNFITTIFYDTIPKEPIWVVVYYRNINRFPITRLAHFKSIDDAKKYIEIIEPTIPLQSLGGLSPEPALSYSDYVKWKKQNNLIDFHPDRAYSHDGENRREKIIQDEERFNSGLMSVRRILNEY